MALSPGSKVFVEQRPRQLLIRTAGRRAPTGPWAQKDEVRVQHGSRREISAKMKVAEQMPPALPWETLLVS